MHHHHVMTLMGGGAGGADDDGDGGVNCSHTKRFVVEVVAMMLRMMRMKGKRREGQQEWEYRYIYEFLDIGLPYSLILYSLIRICSALPLATHFRPPTPHHHPTNIHPCCPGGTVVSMHSVS